MSAAFSSAPLSQIPPFNHRMQHNPQIALAQAAQDAESGRPASSNSVNPTDDHEIQQLKDSLQNTVQSSRMEKYAFEPVSLPTSRAASRVCTIYMTLTPLHRVIIILTGCLWKQLSCPASRLEQCFDTSTFSPNVSSPISTSFRIHIDRCTNVARPSYSVKIPTPDFRHRHFKCPFCPRNAQSHLFHWSRRGFFARLRRLDSSHDTWHCNSCPRSGTI